MPTNDPDRTAQRPDSGPNPIPNPDSTGADDTHTSEGPAGTQSGGMASPTHEGTDVRPPAPERTVVRPTGEVVEPSVDVRPANSPTVPGYEIEKELGRGAMGVVYLARQTALKRTVALKMILSGAHSDPVTQARFEIEAEAVAAVRHPNVVAVHDFGRVGELPYFSLEFVSGGTLADRLRKDGKFLPMAAAVVVAKLAAGMAAVHGRGIIHRDLKPANVLLTEDGEPKVTDFGLARIGKSDMTATNAVMGTPSYMSPEQAAGKVKEVGTATDVWSLGAILYDLLLGRPPFRGDSVMTTIQQVLIREPDRPRTVDGSIPRDLETICLKCLDKDPNKRYATAAELGSDLGAFLDGRPIAARPVSSLERAWKWTKRHPERAAGVVAGVVLAVGLVVAWGQIQAQRADDRIAADEAVKRQERETRAASLVEGLGAADTAVVPTLLTALADYRDLTGPKLREVAAQAVNTKPGLHARLALLSEEPGRAGELAKYLPECRPEELLPIRSALAPHATAVAPGLWAVVSDATVKPGQRVRTGCTLAGLAPGDDRWGNVAAGIVDGVVVSTPDEFVVWSTALEPVGGRLLPMLLKRYPATRLRIESRKSTVSELAAEALGYDLTASLLARYAADQPSELAELAMIVDARHHRQFMDAIRKHQAEVVPVLKAELGKVAFPGKVVGSELASVVGAPLSVSVSALDPDPVFDALAKRQANAAAVLLALGESESVWPLLRFPKDGDPSARSYLIERLAAIGADPLALIRRFRDEPELSAKRALLIALGDFPVSPLWAGEREALAAELVTLYQEHPDSGLHGAIDWLLRQRWGKAAELTRIDAELALAARGRVAARVVFGAVPMPGVVGVMGVASGPLLPAPAMGRDRDWYVNGEGQTYTVVRGPVESTLGSPATEPGRFVNEKAHRKRIGRSFAIATKEVTVEQFLRFREHRWEKRYSPYKDSPVVFVSWYEAAAFCNWLSAREGIPPDQWCYEPNTKGMYDELMSMKPNHLNLAGYRLATNAEWEYACRSGSVVSRYFGRSHELLQRYAWYQTNGDDQAWQVGRLRPNELGLFDILGNAVEWVEDPTEADTTSQYDDIEYKEFLSINEKSARFVRGGSFVFGPVVLRCAYRSNLRPSFRYFSTGFRVARTFLD